MVRFLHTADWQMGMRAAHAGRAGERVREARLESARRAIEVAREKRAAFVVLAGDTFEDNAVDRVLVQRVADVLAAFPVPVFVLPGNHDPLVPGSVFDLPAWSHAKSVVTILRDAAPVAAPGATLFPCPLRAKSGTKDPTESIPAPLGDPPAIRIGVAHGTLEGVGVEVEDEFPIPLDAAERRRVDYLAIGHWHSTFLPSPGARVAYSGTHETTKFGERDSGNVLVVEIDAPGARPRVERVATGTLAWRDVAAEVTSLEDVRRVADEIASIAEPEKTLVRVRLSGTLGADALAETSRIEDVVAARFLFGRLDLDGLALAPEDAAWIDALPPGPLPAVARRLSAAEGPAAREALLRLYALSREGRARR